MTAVTVSSCVKCNGCVLHQIPPPFRKQRSLDLCETLIMYLLFVFRFGIFYYFWIGPQFFTAIHDAHGVRERPKKSLSPKNHPKEVYIQAKEDGYFGSQPCVAQNRAGSPSANFERPSLLVIAMSIASVYFLPRGDSLVGSPGWAPSWYCMLVLCV